MTVHDRPVLVVEDSDEDWDTVQQAGRQSGFAHRLQRAGSGEEGLRLLRGTASDDPLVTLPALVLLDLNLPGIDGHEVLVSIKGDVRLKQLPVVVLTTSSNSRHVESCYAAGANAYHIKPMRYPDHLDTVRTVFQYWLTSVTPLEAATLP